MKITSLTRGDVLFSHAESTMLIPASNVKLFTAAAALKILGPQYKFTTTFAVSPQTKIENGSLKGDLYVKGGGDPSLVSEAVWLIARELNRSGITSVEGDLVVDESHFNADRYAPGWGSYEKEKAYNAPTGALSVNFNSITLYISPADEPGRKAIIQADPEIDYLRVENHAVTAPQGERPSIDVKRKRREGGDVAEVRGRLPAGGPTEHFYLSVSDPPAYAGQVLIATLAKEGVGFKGRTKVGQTPPEHKVILEHISKPLWQIVADMNKYSNNFVAEQLLKVIGAETTGRPGAFIDGLAAVKEFVAGKLPRGGGFNLVDGSGLSRENRLSAAKIVEVLAYMERDLEAGPEFVVSLAVPGSDGTMKKRLDGSDAQKRMRLKSGWLYGAGSLSGYAVSRDRELLAFSSIINSSSCENAEVKSIQDKLSLSLINFQR